MKLLGKYQNGNYTVSIYDDGTKVRENDLDHFEADFPESIDLKITNLCRNGCEYCHENSGPDGKHAELFTADSSGDKLSLDFLTTMPPYSEIAIGGGNPLAHPDLIPFLKKLREYNLIPNMTVNQKDFLRNVSLLQNLTEQGILFGLGVSYMPCTREEHDRLVTELKKFPNAVIHVINGVIKLSELKSLAWNDFKLLILGYKDFRRGREYRVGHMEQVAFHKHELWNSLSEIILNGWFDVVSFDNLAIKQLDVNRMMSHEHWQEFYMGDDGEHTMYVDAVTREFAVSSVSKARRPITGNIKDMFHVVKSEAKNAG